MVTPEDWKRIKEGMQTVMDVTFKALWQRSYDLNDHNQVSDILKTLQSDFNNPQERWLADAMAQFILTKLYRIEGEGEGN